MSSTYIVEIAIINQLHDEKDVEEQLGLWMLHNLLGPLISAMELLLHYNSIV